MNVAELIKLQAELIAMEPGPRFLGIPDRWYADGPDMPYGHPDRGARFRCVGGHVSKCVLGTEDRGDRCLECGGELVMTFPEDEDD